MSTVPDQNVPSDPQREWNDLKRKYRWSERSIIVPGGRVWLVEDKTGPVFAVVNDTISVFHPSCNKLGYMLLQEAEAHGLPWKLLPWTEQLHEAARKGRQRAVTMVECTEHACPGQSIDIWTGTQIVSAGHLPARNGTQAPTAVLTNPDPCAGAASLLMRVFNWN